MKLTYRPEIDGLRAIAVGAVILYHAQITIFGHQPFKGGFIGVDIFFVISGYLITSIILKELFTTGSFSFKHFYERRVRRILPALLFVMLVSLPFAWMYLLPSSFVDFSKSILYSLSFSSNFYFHYSGQEYGAESGLLKPFLHTWSLSVEEQFYILFPIILLITYICLRKSIVHILITGFVVSLCLAEWTTRNYPSVSFYFLHTRMWELLAGSVLAYFEITNGKRSENKILNSILPIIGLLLILLTIIFFKTYFPHPSLHSLPAVIGVCLIIWFSDPSGIVIRLLSTKLFVGIGLISYSLYLWHYPIFAFARVTDFTQKSLFDQLLLGIIILILSTLSYYFIERPARNKNNKFKVVLIFILILISVLVIVNNNIIQKGGYKHRFYVTKNYELDRGKYHLDSTIFETNYNFDDYDDRKNVLIVGNSFAEDILKIFSKTNLVDRIYFNLTSPKKRYEDYNFQIRYLYKFLTGEKSIIDWNGVNFYSHLKKQYENSDLIILSSQYHSEDLNILDYLIKDLKKDNKKVILFDNALEQSTKAGINRLDYYVYINKKLPDKDDLKKIEQDMFLDLMNKKEINDKIKLIAKKNNVYLIIREKIFCDLNEKRCPSITQEGYKIYWDYGHLTDKGAEFFAKVIEKNELFLEYLYSSLYMSSK